MSIENTPTQGLTIDQAVQQLQTNREQTQIPEQLQEEEVEEVVGEEEVLTGDENLEDDSDSEPSLDDSESSEEEEVFLVQVGDEEVEVSGDELTKGYLRQQDYTKKRQADGKAAKELQAQYTAKLSELDNLLAQNVSQEQTQLQQLNQRMQQTQDPQEREQLHYKQLVLQQQVMQKTQQAEAIKNFQDQSELASQQASQAEQISLLNDQYENWPAKAEELKGYLETEGFTDLSVFVDARMAAIVDKAKQFDALQQQKVLVQSKKLKRKVPNTLKAGAGEKQFNQSNQALEGVRNQFANSRSLNDAFMFASQEIVGTREDLSDMIYNIDPTETPVVSAIGVGDGGGNTLFDWQTDSLDAPSNTNAKIEGEDASASALTPTVRLNNYMQISDKVYGVTGTANALDSAGRSDELDYQRLKKGV